MAALARRGRTGALNPRSDQAQSVGEAPATPGRVGGAEPASLGRHLRQVPQRLFDLLARIGVVLKLAGEWGNDAPKQLRAVAAVCPAMDLAASADALHEPANRIYEYYFLQKLFRRIRTKDDAQSPLRRAADPSSKPYLGRRLADPDIAAPRERHARRRSRTEPAQEARTWVSER